MTPKRVRAIGCTLLSRRIGVASAIAGACSKTTMDGIGRIADGKHHGSTFGRLAAQLLSDPLIGRGHKDARPPGGGQTACTPLVLTE